MTKNSVSLRLWAWLSCGLLLSLLAGCFTRAPAPKPSQPAPPMTYPALDGSSRWVAANWADLPGYEQDQVGAAWGAWLQSCNRPLPSFVQLCQELRALTIADEAQQRQWIQTHLQPYRVESSNGSTRGLLTSYYEPIFIAQSQAGGAYQYPLYAPPAGYQAKSGWFSRQEADTLPQAKAALQGKALAWFDNPIDPLILQIQGSGQVRMLSSNGQPQLLRLAYAGTNQKPYQSVSKWLAANTSVRNYSWPAIKQWAQTAQPSQVQQMLWSNPRVVFFQAQAVSDTGEGPKGAQGVPLTPGRSIAVDPGSIPYGAPVWLASDGADRLQRLVIAQDTGSAIRGAVRADYFAGTGDEAGLFANRIKQPLWLWVLWPKRAALPH